MSPMLKASHGFENGLGGCSSLEHYIHVGLVFKKSAGLMAGCAQLAQQQRTHQESCQRQDQETDRGHPHQKTPASHQQRSRSVHLNGLP